MTTYYVDTATGNDSNAGTATGTAWLTINKANTTMSANDTVYIRAGTYEDDPIVPGANNVTYEAYTGETPILKRSAIGTVADLLLVNNYTGVTIDGISFDVSNSPKGFTDTDRWPLLVYGDDTTIQNCNIYHASSTGDDVYDAGWRHYGLTINGENCTVYANTIEGMAWGIGVGKDVLSGSITYNTIRNTGFDCIYVGSPAYELRELEIGYNTLGPSYYSDGIQLVRRFGLDDAEANADRTKDYPTTNYGAWIHHNIIKHCGENAIDFKSSAYLIIESNVIYGTRGSNDGDYAGWNTNAPSSIGHGARSPAFQVIIRNNVLYDGQEIETDERHYIYNNTLLANNRDYRGSGQAGRVGIWNTEVPSTGGVKNNIIAGHSAGELRWRVTHPNVQMDVDYNLYTGSLIDYDFYRDGRELGQFYNLAAWTAFMDDYTKNGGADANSVSAASIDAIAFADVDTSLLEPNGDATAHTEFDFSITASSPAYQAGGALTTATNAATSSKQLVVADAGYFWDGWAITTGDLIRIGSGDWVEIDAINYTTNAITLTEARTWAKGDGVYYDHAGSSPSIGAGNPTATTGNLLRAAMTITTSANTSPCTLTATDASTGTVASYSWEIFTSAPASVATATDEDIAYSVVAADTYKIVLIITDADGNTSTATEYVVIGATATSSTSPREVVLDACSTSTGSQVITFTQGTPSAVCIYVAGSASGSADDLRFGAGMTDGTTHVAYAMAAEHGTASPSARRYSNTGKVIELINDSGTVIASASVTSLTSSALTLNWTTAPAVAYDLIAEGWFASSASVDVVDISGGSPVNTTPGFTPDALVLMANGQAPGGSTSFDARLMLGYAANDGSATQGSVYTTIPNAGGTGDRSMTNDSTMVIAAGYPSNTAAVTFAAGQYTLTPSTSSLGSVSVLSLDFPADVDVDVDVVDSPTSSPTDYALSFKPGSVSHFMTNVTVVDTVTTNKSAIGVHVSDGTYERSVMGTYDDPGTTNSTSRVSDDWLFQDDTDALIIQGSVSFATDKYTGTMSSTAGTARKFVRLALETVATAAPNVSFETQVSASPVTTCTTSDTVTYVATVDSDVPYNFLWDFGDGTTSTEDEPTHQYSEEGSVTVTLTVTTVDGVAETVTQALTVTLTALTPTFSVSDSTIEPGDSVTLNCTTDVTGYSIRSYVWNIVSSDHTVVARGRTVSPTIPYGGTYDVTLYIEPTYGSIVSATSASAITVAPDWAVDFYADLPGTSIGATVDVTFTPVVNYGPAADGNETYAWDFDFVANPGTDTSTSQSPTNTFSAGASYTVKLTVTSSDGYSQSKTKTDYITIVATPTAPATQAQIEAENTRLDALLDTLQEHIGVVSGTWTENATYSNVWEISLTRAWMEGLVPRIFVDGTELTRADDAASTDSGEYYYTYNSGTDVLSIGIYNASDPTGSVCVRFVPTGIDETLLLDNFATAEAAPLTDPRSADTGSWNITDTGNRFSVGNLGLLNIASGGSRTDPVMHSASGFTAQDGLCFKCTFRSDLSEATPQAIAILGFDSDGSGEQRANRFQLSGGRIYLRDGNYFGGTQTDAGGYSALIDYELAIILDGTNANYYVKGGAWAGWTLLGQETQNAAGTVYAALCSYNRIAVIKDAAVYQLPTGWTAGNLQHLDRDADWTSAKLVGMFSGPTADSAGIERDGDDYWLTHTRPQGTWKIQLLKKTSPSTIHVLADWKWFENDVAVQTLHTGASVHEYAANKSGGGFMGNGHGNDTQSALTISVDGTDRSGMTDGQSYSGNNVVVTRTSTLDDGTNTATVTTTYTMHEETGLTVSVSFNWTAGSNPGGWGAMMPFDSVLDTAKLIGSRYYDMDTVAAGAQDVVDTDTMFAFERDGNYAILGVSDTSRDCNAFSGTPHKFYTELDADSYTFNYRVVKLTDAGRLLIP